MVMGLRNYEHDELKNIAQAEITEQPQETGANP
jgi:hypothetical protein